MNLPFPLAQITPAIGKSAMVIASFWNSPLGILVVVALIAILAGGLAFGLRAQTKTPQSPLEGSVMPFVEKLFGDFTNVLAWLVIILAFIGIFLLCYIVLTPTTNKDTAQYVFGAVLPLLGTWVGAVLAHYFQKENLAAATQSISDLASKVTGADKLKSTPVKTVMIRPDRIDTLPDDLLGKADNEIKLSELLTHLNITIKRDRLPIFKDKKKTGPINRVLHRSIIERFIAKQALLADEAGKPQLDATQIANLTLADLMNDRELGLVVLGSFALVKSEATLADAKNSMDNASAALGSKGNCYDIFVTDNGTADETVVGWITNDVINENAKV
jgi:hypothetical protein